MESVDPRQEPSSANSMKWPIFALVGVLAGATVVTAAYLYHEKQQNRDLAVTNQSLGASLVELRGELQLLRDKLNAPPQPTRITLEPDKRPQSAARPAKKRSGQALNLRRTIRVLENCRVN